MPDMCLNRSIERMADRIAAVLNGDVHSIWLYGSVVLDDFRPGWSDIDLLVLTNHRITDDQARELVALRQTMTEAEPDNPYYRVFEGIIAEKAEYLAGSFTRLVYWGTTGQRITDSFRMDAFSAYELAKYGKSVFGGDDRGIFVPPSAGEMTEAVRQHYEAIRKYAVRTDEKLYSCGWLLDIARCVFTLRDHDVMAKTQAGIRALSEHIFPDEAPMKRAVEIRQNPMAYRGRDDVKQWLKELGPAVQRYADVLERELYCADPCRASSLSYRKTKRVVIPEHMSVLREDQFDAAQCRGTDEPYFKMVHRLSEIPCPDLPAPFAVVRAGTPEFARHIGECYTDECITADELDDCARDPGLWLAVADTANGRIVASCIADIDPDIGEGSLEWIQVSPDYRRRGLGRYIVCELLRRMSGKAGFATVSGKLNNPDHPLELYRSCGFTDCATWHVIRNSGPAR